MTYEEFGEGLFFVTDQHGFAFIVRCLADEFLKKETIAFISTLMSALLSTLMIVCVPLPLRMDSKQGTVHHMAY